MDHLPQLLGRELKPFKIPCLDTLEYKADRFLQYPETRGYSLDDIYAAQFRSKDTPHAASFLQGWLFFGLLSAITGIPVRSCSYVRTLADGQRVIDTSPLPMCIASWKSKCEGLTESQREDNAKNARAIFGIVYNVLEALQKQNASLLDARIELSIVCLANTLATAARDHYQDPDIVFPKVRCVFLEDALLDDGWCPSTIEFIASNFNAPSQYFLYTMGPPEDMKSHTDCSQLVCFAKKRNPTAWPLSHRPLCTGNCPPFAISTERIGRILGDGSFPIIMVRFTNEETEDIRLCNEGFHFEIFVDSSRSGHPYVPIFQVWSDGLGNIQHGSMALCQLLRLQRLANSLYGKAQDKSIPIWIDILCVPLRPQNHHALALDTLSAVYHESDCILVLEEALQATSTKKRKEYWLMEIIYRIMTSAWFQ